MRRLLPAPAGLRAVAAWTALVACETLAQVAMRLGGETLAERTPESGWLAAVLADPWLIVGLAGYLGSFAAWMVILDRLPLSLGFPLTSVVVVAVTTASVLILGEALTPLQAAGTALIVLGVVLTGREGA